MKQSNIIAAHDAIQRLTERSLPLKLAYQVYRIKKAIQVPYDFHIEEEKKILEKLKPEYIEGGYRFKSAEEVAEYKQFMKELNDMEVEPIEKVRIPLSLNIDITPADIDALDGVIEFYEEVPE